MVQAYLEKTTEIRWSKLTPGKARKEIPLALEMARAAIEKICEVEEPTYENTFGALDKSDEALNMGWQRLSHLRNVCDTPELREVLAELMPQVVTYSVEILLNERLYSVLKRAAAQDWVCELSAVQKRYVEETLAAFKENGAELGKEQKKRIGEITTRLAELSRTFGERVLDSTNAWEHIVRDEAELDGLPESAREAARCDALAKGYGSEEEPVWRFTLQFTSTRPVLTYAHSEALRREVWAGLQTRGAGKYDTQDLIREMLELRAEKAHLLGFGSYADYVTSRRMAGSGKRALEFINQLHDEVHAAYIEEQESVRVFAERAAAKTIDRMLPWDVAYRTEQLRREKYDFDAEQLRSYFPMQRVLRGMFSIYEELYGIRITERPTHFRTPGDHKKAPANSVEVWHPEVMFFEIHDEQSGEHLASFYADWYPRESKRGGAWMDCLICGRPPVDGNPRCPHIALMCGNLSRPVGDKPALLSHEEVVTIFHEFGHLLHQALSEVEISSLAGCNVAWDFVELPSQINENWTWQSEALDRIAQHYETGSPLPPEMKKKMLEARNFGSATAFMRQLSFGKLDLELHQHTARYAGRDIEEIDREILSTYRVPLAREGNSMLRAFTHIFDGGYEAGYYSYKWAEMLEADAFTRFLNEGIFNPKTGRDFRRCILSRGNSEPPARLFRDFMGRDPDTKAMLIRAGIK